MYLGGFLQGTAATYFFLMEMLHLLQKQMEGLDLWLQGEV